MDQRERQVIDDLFGKLRQVDSQSPPRDAEAEAHIRNQLASLPAAPYYMAQAILAQEQALASAQQRIQELEQQAARQPAGGGFLSGLFGGGQTAPAPRQPVQHPRHIPQQHMQPGMGAGQGSPWGRPAGGGFLAGAMQTALGVAGGMLVANAISDAFGAGAAEAGELVQGVGDQAQDAMGMEPDPALEDSGFDSADFGDDTF